MCGKAKRTQKYEYGHTYDNLLWNLYILTSPAWSVATRKRTVEQTCPTSMKGQRRYFEGGEDDTRQKACYMKPHNAEILAFSKA